MMKKIFAICALFALPLVISNCSSDDTVIRNQSDYEGVWETDSLIYSFGTRTFKHLFNEMPPSDGQQNGEQTTKEVMTLTKKDASIVETTKNGVQKDPVKGVIANDVISFNSENPRYTDRKILSSSKTNLRVEYNITMRGTTLPVTVTYKKIK